MVAKNNPFIRLAIQTAGERAFDDGLQPCHCPYQDGQPEYDWWHSGYMDAQEDALAQRHIEGKA